MSYMPDLRAATNAAHLPQSSTRVRASAVPSSLLGRANARVSEALEATILVATLSGVSLVMSTVAAGAF